MNPLNLIRVALRALQRNKLRAFLTMLGIIIGVAAVITMVAIGQGSKQSIHEQLSSMGSNMITVLPASNSNSMPGGVRLGASSLQTLTYPDVQALQKKSEFLSAISPVSSTSGQAIDGAKNWPTQLQGVAPEYFDIRKLTLKDGIVFSDQEVKEAAKVCVLGQTVINNLFEPGVNPIGKIIRFGKIPLTVIGILNVKGVSSFGQDQDDIILAPYTTVQKRILATIYFQSIYASSTTEQTSDTATKEISEILRAAHRLRPSEDDDFTIRTMQELLNTLNSTSQLLTVLLTAIAGISLVIGGIGIMNIMYVSVTERTKEIGLRMSIGARGIDILLQFLIEAIVISVTGGLIGIALGVVASLLVTALLSWPTLISETSIIISFVVCAVTGVFFGYYPALKASQIGRAHV